VPGTEVEHTEKVPARKELLDDLRKKSGGQKQVSITVLSPLCGLRKWEGPERNTLDGVQNIHAHAPHVQNICAETHKYRMCVQDTRFVCLCYMWVGFMC
jgi:hypothetical protein